MRITKRLPNPGKYWKLLCHLVQSLLWNGLGLSEDSTCFKSRFGLLIGMVWVLWIPNLQVWSRIWPIHIFYALGHMWKILYTCLSWRRDRSLGSTWNMCSWYPPVISSMARWKKSPSNVWWHRRVGISLTTSCWPLRTGWLVIWTHIQKITKIEGRQFSVWVERYDGPMGGPIFEGRTNDEHPAKPAILWCTRVPKCALCHCLEVARLLLQLAFGRGFPWVRQTVASAGRVMQNLWSMEEFTNSIPTW